MSDVFNGHTNELAQSNVNPELIRTIQHLLTMAHAGQIVGAVTIGVGPSGETSSGICLPNNAQAAQIAIGQMECTKADLVAAVKQLTAPANVSRILKPIGMRAPNG